jgi:hypothetical protein
MKLPNTSRYSRNALRVAVGTAALIAPALHSITDAMEWYQHGFSMLQLWLNYFAFLPMAWLLLGIFALHEPKPNSLGLVGALLYGAAFTYFAHTTLFAISERIASYDLLWSRLGFIYTIHGALMVTGGLLFSWSAWRAAWLPKMPIGCFSAGLVVNLLLALVPAPDILQTLGSALRNTGLILMGYSIMFGSVGQRPNNLFKQKPLRGLP